MRSPRIRYCQPHWNCMGDPGQGDSPRKIRMLSPARGGGTHASQAKATKICCVLLFVFGSWERWEAEVWVCYVAKPSCQPMFFLADVNVAFQQSAHKVLLDDDNLLPLLHLTIEYHGKEHKGLPFCRTTFCFLLLLICSATSASTYLHRSHSILDLRNQLVHIL